RVWDGATGALVREFSAYDPAFRGGANVATADINLDGRDEVVTGAGPGGGPHVKVFDGGNGALNLEFFAYDAAFRGGVSVADTAPGVSLVPDGLLYDAAGQLRSAFFAYDPAWRGGASVAVLPVGTDGASAIVTGAGPGGGPHVKQWEFPGPALTHELFAFDP